MTSAAYYIVYIFSQRKGADCSSLANRGNWPSSLYYTTNKEFEQPVECSSRQNLSKTNSLSTEIESELSHLCNSFSLIGYDNEQVVAFAINCFVASNAHQLLARSISKFIRAELDTQSTENLKYYNSLRNRSTPLIQLSNPKLRMPRKPRMSPYLTETFKEQRKVGLFFNGHDSTLLPNTRAVELRIPSLRS